jgi:hypothetical protein
MFDPTCLPVLIARETWWDLALEQRSGEAVGLESRAEGAGFSERGLSTCCSAGSGYITDQ